MYVVKYLIFIIFFLIEIPQLIIAQQSNLQFWNIKIGNSFAQNEIQSIIQDKKGFMWFATRAGLYKYNGYTFKRYKHESYNNNCLSNNSAEVLFQDENGDIWIGTSDGLNKFDVNTENFVSFKHLAADSNSISDNFIRTIYEDHYGMLWIGTANGLNSFDRYTKKFYKYFNNKADSFSISSNDIRAIYEDKNNDLWIGTDNGLNLFERNANQFHHYKVPSEKANGYWSNQIRSIFEDSYGELWIGTFKSIEQFNRQTKQFKLYDLKSKGLSNFLKNSELALKEFLVYSIAEDNSRTLWISSQYGLFQFVRSTGKFIHHNIITTNSNTINSNFVNTLFTDKSGIVWLGMYGEGIYKLFSSLQLFKNYSYFSKGQFKIDVKSVRTITNWGRNKLLIGGYLGLDVIDRETKNNSHLLENEAIFSIQKDIKNPQKYLWIGRDVGGLCKFNLLTKKLKQYKLENPNPISGEVLSCMLFDKKGTLWIGTEKGLNKFDTEKEKAILYSHESQNQNSISNNKVNALYEDKEGLFWVGTDNGLNIFDKKKEKFRRFLNQKENLNSLSNNSILSIYEDRNGYIWIGTNGGGLNKYDKKLDLFQHYSETNGLSDNVIYAILEDNNGNIWTSTNNGISKLNISNEIFWNYDEKYGLQDNEFNRNAFLKSESGEIFFGGIKGFNAFYPNQIVKDEQIPPIEITNFELGNVVVTTQTKFNGHKILAKPITETKSIILSYEENIFTFEFASLEYYTPLKTKYAYKLEGLDNEWNYVGNRRFATYNSIPPGNYIFKVKAQNNNGVWSGKDASIKVIIQPPFWKTYWFYIIVLVSVIYIIYLVFQFRLEQLLKVERLRVKLASDLHDDIGATLSKISMQAEIVKQGIDPENSENNLTRISELCSYSIDTMRDIVWSIDSRNDSLEKMLNKMKDETYKLLQSKNIEVKFNVVGLDIQRKISAETRQNLYLILKEAVNNIYKHSNANKVEITVSQVNSRLKLRIYDNGDEIKIKEYSSGHGLSNMKMRVNKIGGDFNFSVNDGFAIQVENVKLK